MSEKVSNLAPIQKVDAIKQAKPLAPETVYEAPKPQPNRDAITEMEQKMLAMREKDRKPVRGMFKFYEAPGGFLEFNFRKYKGDDVQYYKLVDGQTYTIPLGVAKHLNTGGAYPIHDYVNNEFGKPVSAIKTMVRRFGFQSLEFTGQEEFEDQRPTLSTVHSL